MRDAERLPIPHVRSDVDVSELIRDCDSFRFGGHTLTQSFLSTDTTLSFWLLPPTTAATPAPLTPHRTRKEML